VPLNWRALVQRTRDMSNHEQQGRRGVEYVHSPAMTILQPEVYSLGERNQVRCTQGHDTPVPRTKTLSLCHIVLRYPPRTRLPLQTPA